MSAKPSATPSSGPRRPKRHQRRWDAGFSLVEVLASSLMVILLATATAKALIGSSHFSGDQRFRSQADSVASQDQERLRGLSDLELNQLESASQTRTVTLNKTTFSVISSVSYLDTTGNTGCSATAAAYYKVSSTVTWSEGFSNRPATLTEDGVLSRPVSGDLPVVVTDQTGQPLSGVTVQASGPSLQTSPTDSTGCVLFAGLVPGSYNVTFTDPGYVDPDGDQSPLTVAATVATTGTGTQTVHMGLSGLITGTFTAATGLASPTTATGEADGISWSGAGGSDAMSAPAVNTASTPQRTLATDPLYPFSAAGGYTNNYTVWAGRCPQERPPAGNDAFTVAPGANLSQNIAEPLLNLGVTYNAGSVKPGHVKMAFSSLTGASCSDSWSPTIGTGGATGWLANPGQPYVDGTTGAMTVCVDYKSGFTTYEKTVNATNTSFTSMNPVTVALTSSSTKGSC
jgi:type II secretory pathway pseudopilin PulG